MLGLETELVEDGFDKKIAAVALSQHSVITYDDAVASGGNKDHIRTRVKSGRWIAVHPYVYRLAGAPWTWEGQVYAAVAAAGPDAAASFFCAARLQGFAFMKALPEISIPRGNKFRPKGIRVHTSTDLDRCNLTVCKGIRVTDPARTLLDVGGALNRRATFARTVEQARRLDKVDWHDLVVCLAAHARRGRNGITWMRELLEVSMSREEVTDTDSELIAYALLLEHGLPRPKLHHRMYTDDGSRIVADMDLAYVERRLNFEIDGDAHLDPVVKQKDDARDAELREVYDWTVRRIWWEIPVYHPQEFLRIVRSYVTWR